VQVDEEAKTMNSDTEALLAGLDPQRRARVEREMTAEVAWSVLKQQLAQRYGFVASKIEQRVHLMWIDGDTVDFKDAATKARMWANVRTRTADLVRDARWTAEVMADYRTDNQLPDDWVVTEQRTVKRLKSVRWVRANRDALVEIYKQNHNRNFSAPMGQAVLALLAQVPKEDRIEIEEALAEDSPSDRKVAAALQCVAIDEAVLEQDMGFREHPKYEQGLALVRRWKHGASTASRAIAWIEAEDVCAEINEGAWVTGSSALDCMLRDLAGPEERLMAA